MNTKLNHSRAPWRVSGQPCYAGFKVVDATDRSVAAFPSNSTRPEEERSANAALIAASPELLDALQDLLMHVQVQHKLNNVVTERARAAISKAIEGV